MDMEDTYWVFPVGICTAWFGLEQSVGHGNIKHPRVPHDVTRTVFHNSVEPMTYEYQSRIVIGLCPTHFQYCL